MTQRMMNAVLFTFLGLLLTTRTAYAQCFCNQGTIAPGASCEWANTNCVSCCASGASEIVNAFGSYECCETSTGLAVTGGACNVPTDCCYGFCVNGTGIPGGTKIGTCCSYDIVATSGACYEAGGGASLPPGHTGCTAGANGAPAIDPKCTTDWCAVDPGTGLAQCCGGPGDPMLTGCCAGELPILPGTGSVYGQQVAFGCCIPATANNQCNKDDDCCSHKCTNHLCIPSGTGGHCQYAEDCALAGQGALCENFTCQAPGQGQLCAQENFGCNPSVPCCNLNGLSCIQNQCLPPPQTGQACDFTAWVEIHGYTDYQANCPNHEICPPSPVSGGATACCIDDSLVAVTNASQCCSQMTQVVDHQTLCVCLQGGADCTLGADWNCCGYPNAMCVGSTGDPTTKCKIYN
jgi:hypothetical protein